MIRERTLYTAGTINEQLEFLCKELSDILALSNRGNMNDLRFLRDRRIRAIALKTLLDQGKKSGYVDDALSARGKDLVMAILFENWSRQLLPQGFGVIHKGNTKQQDYLNSNGYGHALEPRSYIGIDPNAYSDLDFPSFVVAETPPHYKQPLHNHSNTAEITFFNGPSVCEYIDAQGNTQVVPVDYGDIMIFDAKTLHTIANNTDEVVMNMSVKLPEALQDRGKEAIAGVGSARKISMKQREDGNLSEDFSSIGATGYTLLIENFDRAGGRYLSSQGKSIGYILEGEFLVQYGTGKNHVVSAGDTIVFNKDNIPLVTAVNNTGKIYTVNF